MGPRARFVGKLIRRPLIGRGRYVLCWLVVGAYATCTRSALAQAPAPPAANSAQPMALVSDPPPAPGPATLTDPSYAFGQPSQVAYQAALTGTDNQPAIDFFGIGTLGALPWSSSATGDSVMQAGARRSNGSPRNFNLEKAGLNYNTRVTASSSTAEPHAVGHAHQTDPQEPKPTGYTANGTPLSYSTNFSFDTNATARAAVNEDTTRLGAASAGGFLPSSIPVDGQPFFGTPAHTSVQGSGSTLSM
jgi:hypothetical protein